VQELILELDVKWIGKQKFQLQARGREVARAAPWGCLSLPAQAPPCIGKHNCQLQACARARARAPGGPGRAQGLSVALGQSAIVASQLPASCMPCGGRLPCVRPVSGGLPGSRLVVLLLVLLLGSFFMLRVFLCWKLC